MAASTAFAAQWNSGTNPMRRRIAADASVTSIGSGNSARLAYGWRLFESFYVGPEIHVLQSEPYVAKRVGVHLTALRYLNREWWGAAGVSSDNDQRSGLYVRMGMLMRK